MLGIDDLQLESPMTRTPSAASVTNEWWYARARNAEARVKEQNEFIRVLQSGTVEGDLRARVKELETQVAHMSHEMVAAYNLRLGLETRLAALREALEDLRDGKTCLPVYTYGGHRVVIDAALATDAPREPSKQAGPTPHLGPSSDLGGPHA